MKAMMIKDIKILLSSVKYYFFIIIMFPLLGVFTQENNLFQFYPVLLMAILPITALSYDERSHWNAYGLTLPLSRRDMVLGKYVLGIVGSGLMVLFNLILNMSLPRLISHTPADMNGLTNYMIYVFAASIIFLDLNMPLMYRLGTEKGRIFYLCAMVVIIAIPTVFNTVSNGLPPALVNTLFPLLVVTVLLTIGSMALSVRIFRQKEF